MGLKLTIIVYGYLCIGVLKLEFQIVKMTSDMAEDFGYVVYTAWGETYRGLMPDRVLDGRSQEKWTEMAKARPENKFAAVCGGRIVGILGYLPQARDFVSNKDSGEIVALYVLKDFHRYGIGRALIEKALEAIERPNVTLFVLKGNDNAIGFYKKMGFELTGREVSEVVSGDKITELEMILR